MKEMREWTGEARTAERAVERGLAQLGLKRDDVNVHVVQDRSSGLLSLFGFRRVRVRMVEKRSARLDAYRDHGPDDDRFEHGRDDRGPRRGREERENRGDAFEKSGGKNGRRDRRSPNGGKNDDRSAPRGRGDRRERDERGAGDRRPAEDRRNAPKGARGGDDRGNRPPERKNRPTPEAPRRAEPRPETRAPREQCAPRPEVLRPFLPPETLLNQWKESLGVDDLSWEFGPEQNHRLPVLLKTTRGERLAGKNGRGLEALEYLFNLVSSGGDREKPWVALRLEGFASADEQSVVDKALFAAFQVRRTQQPFRMDPMPPAQRRLVHQALANHPDVETASEGEGPTRKVVVKPRAAGAAPAPNA